MSIEEFIQIAYNSMRIGLRTVRIKVNNYQAIYPFVYEADVKLLYAEPYNEKFEIFWRIAYYDYITMRGGDPLETANSLHL